MTDSNPPTPTSINEILEHLVDMCGGNIWWSYQTTEKNPALTDAKTALYTLIASKAPKKKKIDYCPSENCHYNFAIQDYDNAIKELLK